ARREGRERPGQPGLPASGPAGGAEKGFRAEDLPGPGPRPGTAEPVRPHAHILPAETDGGQAEIRTAPAAPRRKSRSPLRGVADVYQNAAPEWVGSLPLPSFFAVARQSDAASSMPVGLQNGPSRPRSADGRPPGPLSRLRGLPGDLGRLQR